MVTRRWSQQSRVFGAYLGAHTEHSQSSALGYALHAIEKAMTSLYEEELAAASDGGGFQVYPKKSTPHLDCVSADPLDGAKALSAVCARCQETEVWICLKCHAPHCSRYKNGCCKKHAEESGHLIAVSLSDLSVWDYGQDCYLDVYAIPKLRAPYAALHLAKFGEPPSFPGGPVLELGEAPTAENDFLQATDAVTTAVKAYKELWGDDPRYAAARELLMAILESKT